MIGNDPCAAWSPRILSVLRIASALVLLQHPIAKFFGFPHVAYFDNLKIVSLIGIAGVIELVFGLLLLFGLFTRISAFVLSGHLAAVYFIGHAGGGFFPMLNGGESSVLFCFVFFYLAFAGGGPWSLDRLIRKV